MKNNECNIVQDLLPNYAEKLTSNQTNIFIEEHLKDCENCKNLLKIMEKDFEKNKDMQEKETNYAKKFNRKYKSARYTALIIIYSLIFIILAFFGHKLIVFNSLASKMDKYIDKTNYHIEEYQYQGKRSFVEEYWRDGDNYYSESNYGNFTHSICFRENECYENVNGIWVTNDWSKDDINDFLSNNLNFMRITQKELKNPLSILKLSLKKSYINGKKCYCIIDNSDGIGSIFYIERDTGLLLRAEFLNGDMSQYNFDTNSREVQSTLRDFKYEFDTVTDERFVIDSLEKYLKEEEAENSFTNILSLKDNISKVKNAVLHIENVGNINKDGGTYYFSDNGDAKSMLEGIYDSMIGYRSNGCEYQYLGKEKIGDFECHTITLKKETEEYKYSIDIDTGLIIKEEIKINWEDVHEDIVRNYQYTFNDVK